MNEEESIKIGKNEFKIKDCKLMNKYLKNIFWKKIVSQKNQETNLSKLITEISQIPSEQISNQQSCTNQVKSMFSQLKPFIDSCNHEIYSNRYYHLKYYSQVKEYLSRFIPTYLIRRQINNLDHDKQIIQINEDLNNINGTIIYFFYKFLYNEEQIQYNCQNNILIEFLKKCSQIQNLYLNFCLPKFKSEELIDIFKSIRHCKSLISLELNFSKCQIPNDTIEELKLSLQQFVNLRKLTLDLGFNNLESQQVYHIMEGLNNCKLLTDVELYLNNNNNICYSEEYNIFSCFQQIPLTYLYLDISQNDCNEKLQYIGEELKKCQLLKDLTLTCNFLNKYEDHCLIMFGNQIKQYPSLLQLTLNFKDNKNTESVKIEFCKIIASNNLINSIEIDFSTKYNYERNPKSKIIMNLFKKKKNFFLICIDF